MPVDYKKDQEENKEFDEAVDSVSPEGKYQKPPLKNLREGVKIRNRTGTAEELGLDSGQAISVAAPWDYFLGGVAAKKALGTAIGTYGLDKTLEVGINALFPDAPDTLLEQFMRNKQMGLGATAIKGARLTKDTLQNTLDSVFDLRIPNPFEVPTLFETGQGMGPRKGDVKPVRITNRDIPGPVTNPSMPIEAWLGKNPLTGEGKIQLAESVYLDTLKGSNRTKKITNYKLRGQESFQKWAREEYVPLMDAAAKEAGMPSESFYSVISSKPGFKYIEHRIAKRADLRWYWEMTGDPNIPWDVKANDVNNLRLLLDDRFKKLKDVVEVQIYGDSKGLGGINSKIANNADKYIVDIQSPTQGNRFIGLNQNAGDVVIKRAGTGEEVGRIGEYYNVLFSSQKDLMQRLPLKFPELKTMTTSQRKDWIRNWRKGILQDHLDIIRNKEKNLVGLTDTEKSFKIDQALFDDMVDFRQEYEGVLPFLTKGEIATYRKQMSLAEIENIRRSSSKPRYKPIVTEKQKLEGIFLNKTQERKIMDAKRKGRFSQQDLDDIINEASRTPK
tara:strand:- start:165 stop:1838 length:1674 start_codon:yes stop_codon:yes gene_type:complete